jgi:hypothetical protein
MRPLEVFPFSCNQGEKDEIATPADHRGVHDELKREGFRRIRVENFRGPHVVEDGPLRTALDWFRELAVEAGRSQ